MGFISKSKPYAAVIFLQFAVAGLTIITKLALNGGMSPYTLVVYRNAVAAVTLAPFAFVLERKSRPRMTLSIFINIFILALLGPVIDLNLYYLGVKYTTATFTSVMGNIIPSITFALAWILRVERVNLREIRSQGKVVGTVSSLAGAMLMTLYKGPAILGSLGAHHNHGVAGMAVSEKGMFKGSIALIVACFTCAGFVILQGFTLRTYPAELSLTVLVCLMGSVQGTVVALVVEYKNPAAWFIGWDTRLLVILYAGIISSGMSYYLQGVVLKQKGPVFATAFGPLTMVIVAALGPLLLAEEMYMGMIIGAIIIVVGLYLVVWGKMENQSPSLPSSENQVEVTEVVEVVVVQPRDNTMILRKSDSIKLVTIERQRQESI